jgi:hypothetical protein
MPVDAWWAWQARVRWVWWCCWWVVAVEAVVLVVRCGCGSGGGGCDEAVIAAQRHGMAELRCSVGRHQHLQRGRGALTGELRGVGGFEGLYIYIRERGRGMCATGPVVHVRVEGAPFGGGDYCLALRTDIVDSADASETRSTTQLLSGFCGVRRQRHHRHHCVVLGAVLAAQVGREGPVPGLCVGKAPLARRP